MRPVGAEATEKGVVENILLFFNNIKKLFDCVIKNIMLLVFTASAF